MKKDAFTAGHQFKGIRIIVIGRKIDENYTLKELNAFKISEFETKSGPYFYGGFLWEWYVSLDQKFWVIIKINNVKTVKLTAKEKFEGAVDLCKK